MKILTFNWHEAYICSIAKTGHQIEILERYKGGSRIWFYETRPLPKNSFIVKEKTARKRVNSGKYDLVVCHNVKDLLWIKECPVPKILVFHNKLSTEIALGQNRYSYDSMHDEVSKLVNSVQDLHIVFISKGKQEDWRFPGTVITPGVDLNDYDGYCGEETKVLRVGNFMKSRDIMMGYSAQQEILQGIDSTLLGLNQGNEGRFTKSWDDLKECYRSHRVYLNTTVEGYEDGYNLAMLEAMATGMPVVSTFNSTSPIIDGVNGYISEDRGYLSEKIKALLENREEAERIGFEAKKCVKENFNIESFVEKWNDLFFDCTQKGQEKREPVASLPDINESKQDTRKKVLLSYVSYPATTARYLADSFKREHDLVTAGPAIGEDIIKLWDLKNMKEEVKPQDIPCGHEVNTGELLASLPEGWEPELFLWVESVYGFFPKGIQELKCPTACYLIDSHINLSWHIEWATHFDFVFLAQKEYVSRFREKGNENVYWLPLACDPEIHGKTECGKTYDIGFVGSITQDHKRRRELLDKLADSFNVHIERSFLQDMAKTFSASKIVFNDAIKNDLNMRVFEALASGSMLLTDKAPGSGLEEMFTDRTHLVYYNDDNIQKIAEYYLSHTDEREKIAAEGRKEVLKNHTYDHRVKTLLQAVFPESESNKKGEDTIEDPLLLEGTQLLKDKKFEKGLERLVLALEGRELTNDEHFELHNSIGTCMLQLGRDEEGKTHYKKAIELLPSSDKPYMGLGAYYFNAKKYEEAIEVYEKAIRNNPKNSNAVCGSGVAFYYGIDKEKGFQRYVEALKTDPENKTALFMLLQASYEMVRFEEAAECYQNYLELHPADIEILFGLAGIYYMQKNSEKTKEIIDTILIFEPDHQDALALLEKIIQL